MDAKQALAKALRAVESAQTITQARKDVRALRDEARASLSDAAQAPIYQAYFSHGWLDVDEKDYDNLHGEKRIVYAAPVAPAAAAPSDAEFKNFHRLLCERFGYVHDERDWRRDQLSLIECIANWRDQFEYLDAQNHTARVAMRKIMARLTELLDEDRFAEIEEIVRSAGVEPPPPVSPQPDERAAFEAWAKDWWFFGDPDESNAESAAWEAWQTARATAPQATPQTAMQRYAQLAVDKDEADPVERLRAFCSLAMSGQDWMDVEPFFDAITRASISQATGWYERLKAECAAGHGEYPESGALSDRLRWWVPRSARHGTTTLEDDMREAADVLSAVAPQTTSASPLYIWFAEDHGRARNGDHYIRAWTADPSQIPNLQTTIGRPPVVYSATGLTDEQHTSDAAITACALMIKGICMTLPNEQWSRKIEERIRFMLTAPEQS